MAEPVSDPMDAVRARLRKAVNCREWGSREIDRCVLALLDSEAKAREEIERLRMQLVACGVVAMANTPETAAKARDMHPDYRSASCDDVVAAVDREMRHRAEVARLTAEVERLAEDVSAVGANRDMWRKRAEQAKAALERMRLELVRVDGISYQRGCDLTIAQDALAAANERVEQMGKALFYLIEEGPEMNPILCHWSHTGSECPRCKVEEALRHE